jgi:two-component system, cell cycle sensor histidine kinase PleC
MPLLAELYNSAAARLQPRDTDEARLRVELITSVAPIARLRITPFFAAVCGGLSLHDWVAWQYATLWTAAMILYPSATYSRRMKTFAGRHEPADAGRLTLNALLFMMPVHLGWALFFPMCWVTGDIANNALLTVLIEAGMVASLLMYGPCIYLSLPAFALYLPVLACYTLRTGTVLDYAFPLLQILFGLLLCVLTYSHYRTFRQSVFRNFTIEALARNLAATRDAAEQASRAKSAFLASMSHELRTPLNAIIGFSDLIRQSVSGPIKPPKYREYIDDIYSSGCHLLDLINDVLDLSKIEAGKKELRDDRLELDALAHDIGAFVQPQAAAAGVRIATDIAPGTKLIADERAIRQILVNLLSNAIKFSHPGATVELFARTAAGGLAVGVQDHGIGMDETGIRKALEPYGQVAQTSTIEGKGTGLGLPIAKALIEAHGAVLRIESTPGVGTRIWGEFPPARVPQNSRAA